MKTLRRLTFLLILCIPLLGWGYGIVNNTGTTAADSLAIPFYLLDSAGNVTSLAAGDTIHVVVFYPSGGVAYRDSSAYNGSKITVQAFDNSSQELYVWKEAVADIDGTPVNGVYTYILVASDKSGADLRTVHRGSFQLLTADDFHSYMALIRENNDTLRNLDNWVAAQVTLGQVYTEVSGVLDSIQLYDSRWDSLMAAASDGSIGDKVWIDAATRTLSSLGFTLDSSDFQDSSFVARLFHETYWGYLADRADSGATGSSVWTTAQRDTVLNRTLVLIDSLYAVLDSVQNQATIAELASVVADSVLADSLSYQGQASGLTPADVWGYTTRTLTGFSFNVTLADNSLTAAKIATDAFTAAKFAAGCLNGKGDWRVSSTYPLNFGDLAITATNGYVTAGTVTDKTGYGLSTAQQLSLVDDVWDELRSAHVAAGSFGEAVDATISSRSSHSAADVYAEFTSGSNEDVFKADVSGLVTLSAFDSLRVFLGAIPGCKTFTVYHPDGDTLYMVNPAGDTTYVQVYHHPSGTAGDPPDTTKTAAY